MAMAHGKAAHNGIDDCEANNETVVLVISAVVADAGRASSPPARPEPALAL